MKRPEPADAVSVNIEVGYIIPLAEAQADLDARALLAAIGRFKWLVILGPLLGLAAAIAAILLVTPVYRAQLVMVSNFTDAAGATGLGGTYGNLASLAGISLATEGGETEEALAVLRSRRFTTAFIVENDLLPVLFEDEYEDPDEEPPTLWAANEFFEEEVRFLARDETTGLIQLAIDWKDAEEAARWANLLAARANEYIRQVAIREAGRSLDYLYKELESTSILEIRQALFRLIEGQIERIMIANVRAEYAFKIIDPAAAPDEDEYRFPNKPLFVVTGVVGGLLFALFVVFAIWLVGGQSLAAAGE